MSAVTTDARAARILSGSIPRGVFAIAMPSVATMLLQTVNGFLDRFFVGGLGTDALAAVSICTNLFFLLMSAAMAISTGTSALVARFVGAQQREDAEISVQQSLLMGVLGGLACGALLFLFERPILMALGLQGDALESGVRYLRYLVLGLPFSYLMFIQAGAFRGLGDTVRPFWVTLGANLIHVLGNFLLIEGRWGFPRMETAGGALALAISQVVACALQQAFLRRGPLAGAFGRGWRPDRAWVDRIARIGLPAGGQQVLRTGSLLLFQTLLNRTVGTVAVAALGVGLTAESIAFMPGFGYSIAASAFVGQNLGAGNLKRASDSAWQATWQAVGIMSLMGVLFVAGAEPFARLFVHIRPEMTPAQVALAHEQVHLVVLYLRIALISEPFLAMGMVLSGALQGAGETVSPTVTVAVTMLAVRLPLAWILLRYFGVAGAWWAMSLSTVIQGVLMLFIFRSGNWQRVRV